MAELDVKKQRSRTEIANYLREFADKLDERGDVVDEFGSETEKTDMTGTKTSGAETTETDRPGTEAQGTQTRSADHGMTIIVDNESATVTPPETMHFGVEVETDSSLLETGMDRGVTLSLRWDADQVEAPDKLDIE